jgi:hypothetical protein
MGDLLAAKDARLVANTLNWLFNDDLANTFGKVEGLRAVFPNFLAPQTTTDPKMKRRQTLRFAAMLLTDGVPFNDDYPARKFRQWLKWLTWLQVKSGGSVKVNGTAVTGKASKHILDAIATALPHGGRARPVQFTWDEDSSTSGANFAVDIVTTTTPITISIVSVRVNHPSVTEDGDAEDDV